MKTILVTHGMLGKELLNSANMIVGEIENMDAVSLDIGMSPEALINNIESKVERKDNIIILTDIYGGTPFNVSVLLSKKYNISVVCGVNLPMILEISMGIDDNMDLKDYANYISEIGSNSCKVVNMEG